MNQATTILIRTELRGVVCKTMGSQSSQRVALPRNLGMVQEILVFVCNEYSNIRVSDRLVSDTFRFLVFLNKSRCFISIDH